MNPTTEKSHCCGRASRLHPEGVRHRLKKTGKIFQKELARRAALK